MKGDNTIHCEKHQCHAGSGMGHYRETVCKDVMCKVKGTLSRDTAEGDLAERVLKIDLVNIDWIKYLAVRRLFY